MKTAQPLLDVKGVAARFGVPVSWVYAKAEDGTLPSFKLGHYRRFDVAEIKQWLEAQRQGNQ